MRLVGAVGEDWPPEHTRLLADREIDTSGLQVIPGGKTFRWRGKYRPNMNDRETLEVQLNVLGDFDPVLPAEFRESKFLFLANGSPTLQMKVLDQMPAALLVVADTMDLWINIQRDELRPPAPADRRTGAQRQRGQAADRRRESGAGRAQGPPSWGRSSSSSRRASTGRCSSASTKPTSCPPSRRPTWSIRPARATALPAG